jgi:hypothetical protein
MNEIKIEQFGVNLTGRPYGKEALRILSRQDLASPVLFDFENVKSLGSSFAEELLPPFAKSNGVRFVKNTNAAINACVKNPKWRTWLGEFRTARASQLNHDIL